MYNCKLPLVNKLLIAEFWSLSRDTFCAFSLLAVSLSILSSNCWWVTRWFRIALYRSSNQHQYLLLVTMSNHRSESKDKGKKRERIEEKVVTKEEEKGNDVDANSPKVKKFKSRYENRRRLLMYFFFATLICILQNAARK